MTLEVTIKGIKPLLQHSTASVLVPKDKKVKSSEHDVVAEAELCLYKDASGVKCIPFMHFLSSMRKAAVNLKKGAAGKGVIGRGPLGFVGARCGKTLCVRGKAGRGVSWHGKLRCVKVE